MSTVAIMVNGTKRRMLLIPETDPYFKAYRDDFVMFQKLQRSSFPAEDYFSKLSDDVILKIFKWLPKKTLIRCAEVCKRWKTLSYDERLWSCQDSITQNLIINFGKRHVKSGLLDILLRRGVSALRLAMSEIRSPVFVEYKVSVMHKFSRLQYLDLSMASISPESLADILAVCNKLKKLSLEACEVNENCCKFIARNKSLDVLNMTMCSGLTPIGLREIAFNCVKLKEWNLGWTSLNECCLKTFLPVLPKNLTRLNISGQCKTFDDIDLLTIIKRCQNLIELDVSDCSQLTKVSFISLVKTCSKLKQLHASEAFQIPAQYYQYLKHLKNLKNLEIFRTLTDKDLASLRQFMPEIKINTKPFSTIARPTTGVTVTSIWGLKVRD